jgi:hypothetical protein
VTDQQRLKAIEKIIREAYLIKLESNRAQRDKKETWSTYRRRVNKLTRLEIKLFQLLDLDITALGHLVHPAAR